VPAENKKKLSASTSVENTPQNNAHSAQRIDKIKHSLTARSLNIPSLEIKSVENPPSLSELVGSNFMVLTNVFS
jgi:hypothetical protein